MAGGSTHRKTDRGGKMGRHATARPASLPGRGMAAAVLLALAIYAPTIPFGYVLDDDVITRRHDYVQEGLGGIRDLLATNYLYGFNRSVDLAYRPVPLAATALEVEAFGNRPEVHHASNVLLYAATVGVLVWALCVLLPAGPFAGTLAAASGCLFAAHPVHTEVVANLKGREELWAAFLGLLSLGLLFSALGHPPRRGREGSTDPEPVPLPDRVRSPLLLGLSLAAMLGAVSSKETAFSFIPIAFLLLVCVTRLSRSRVAALGAAFAGVGLLSVGIRFLVSRRPGIPAGVDTVINNALLAADGLGERSATLASILGRYVGLLVLPRNLSFDYSYAAIPVVGWNSPAAWTGGLVLLATLGAAAWWLRRSRSRLEASWQDPSRMPPGPAAALAGMSIALLWIALLPGSNLFFLTGTTLAERFLFLPSAGFCLLLAVVLLLATTRWVPRALRRAVYLAAVGVIVGLYGVGAGDRTRDWKSNESLFTAALATTPRSARVQAHAASLLREKGEMETDPARRESLLREALAGYNRSLGILPDFADALYNTGVVHAALGEMDLAEAAYRRTLEADPGYTDALNNLGVIEFNHGNPRGAEAFFSKAVEGNPYHVLAITNLSAAAAAQGNLDRAREVLLEGISRRPDDPALLAALVEIHTRLGDEARARIYRDRLAALGRR